MRVLARSFTIPRLAGAVAAMWLYGAGSAWAGGGGGEDAGSLQTFLHDQVCAGLASFIDLSSWLPVPPSGPLPPICPEYPHAKDDPPTPIVLEIAALANYPPEMVRFDDNIPPGVAVDAANPPSASPPAKPPIASWMSNLTPLAFVSAHTQKGQATATQLYDPDADTFFYAVATAATPQQPDTVTLVYDNLNGTNKHFAKRQTVAIFSFPLVVFNPADGTETQVQTVLQVRGLAEPCAGGPPCYTTDAIANFSAFGTGMCSSASAPNRCSADQLGIQIKVLFGPSAISTRPHTIFQVQVPLLVTVSNDPAYPPYAIFNPLSPLPKLTIFTAAIGVSPAFLKGRVIGMSPASAASGAVPGTAPFTASFASSGDDEKGSGASPRSAVAAYLAVATSGETLTSARLPPPP